MDRRGWIAFALVLLAIGGVVWGGRAWIEAEERAETERLEARRQARLEDAERRVLRLIEESRELMPEIVEGAALGLTVDEVRAARPRLAPARDGTGELLMFEERLANGSQVMYGFDRPSRRLVQVQVLSLLPTPDAIPPHLAAMRDRYGTPTGVWDCPITGGVPTRRFTWRGSQTTLSDVFLIYGERVSQTLYIATTEQIGRSLRMGGCVPVSGERIAEFPVASAEQMRATSAGR